MKRTVLDNMPACMLDKMLVVSNTFGLEAQSIDASCLAKDRDCSANLTGEEVNGHQVQALEPLHQCSQCLSAKR